MILVHPFWGVFSGVLSGIISGVVIYIVYGLIMQRIQKCKAIKHLKFEINFNIEHIDSLLKELQRFRNKVNADDVKNYVGYFWVSKIINTQLAQMFFDRTIYNYLKRHDDISKLQIFSRYFTIESERVVNDRVIHYKDHYEPTMKQQVSKEMEVYEKILDDSKTDLQSIYEKL